MIDFNLANASTWLLYTVAFAVLLLVLHYIKIISLPFFPATITLIHNSALPPLVSCVGWAGDNDGHNLPIDQHSQPENECYPGEKERKNLLKLVQELCPSLNGQKPFYPSFWFANPHLQTMLGPANLAQTPIVEYEREWLALSDGGQIALDWYPQKPLPLDSENDTIPTVLILHGMGGGSHASYAKSLVSLFHNPETPGALPYRSVVFNHRGCGDTSIKTPRLYTAGDTGDLKEAVALLRTHIPKAPLFAVGFSIGGNILAKYLGEVGSSTPFLGAVTISNPFNLVLCSRNMKRRWINRNLYRPFLLRMLKKLFRTHHEMLSQVIKERDWQDICEFEMDLTILNPHVMLKSSKKDICDQSTNKYETLNQYYRDSSCDRHLHNIQTPTLFIHALDDPISPIEAIAADEIHCNPNLIMAATSHGGHVGWWAEGGLYSLRRSTSWATNAIEEFTRAIIDK